MAHEVDHPHDRLFRAVFSDAAEAGGLLRSVLPAEVRERIDWGSLSLQEGTFLDDALRESESDLLYEGRAFRRRRARMCVSAVRAPVAAGQVDAVPAAQVLLPDLGCGFAGGARAVGVTPDRAGGVLSGESRLAALDRVRRVVPRGGAEVAMGAAV